MSQPKPKKHPKPFGLKLEEIPKSYLQENKNIPSFMYTLGRIVLDCLFLFYFQNRVI